MKASLGIAFDATEESAIGAFGRRFTMLIHHMVMSQFKSSVMTAEMRRR